MFKPDVGDVLVSRRTATQAYAVSIVPGPAQISTASRDQAVKKAREYAAEMQMNVWYTEDHIHYLRLAEYRARALQHFFS
jgi:hypothetical protein